MEESKFLRKYMGELTLKNGTHVKFLYPVTKDLLETYKIEAQNIYKNIQRYRNPDSKYWWVLMDNLSFEQFWIVFCAIKKYGDRYWRLTWEEMSKNNA